MFFSNPEKKYYLHEIARLIECPAQNIRRDLLPFVKDEVFKMERVGNLTFYYLNQDYPLYEELKSIITKTVGIEALFKGVLKNISNIQAAFIFGSFAADKERGSSDIDLFILGGPDKDSLIKAISELEKEIHREINYVIYSKKIFQKKKKEYNSFIESIIKNKKIFLIGKESDLER
ncbi:MAG: hypothetical protein A2Z91_02925 [Deltaproteobacteria bacterium GWA2_38_16]|nr:MAG: hypothetical protein A2Z91_02925 [Deltaproteobacteria bacterium GWA2_38_16]OGQ02840.1 MAG: hypothetical protein A3D19_06350 [Deltaproteobacteria bacterium RIFCSPHIGHO2_02_FULL_38_15]